MVKPSRILRLWKIFGWIETRAKEKLMTKTKIAKYNNKVVSQGWGENIIWTPLEDAFGPNSNCGPILLLMHKPQDPHCNAVREKFAKDENVVSLSRYFTMVNAETTTTSDMKGVRPYPQIRFYIAASMPLKDLYNYESLVFPYYYSDTQAIAMNMRRCLLYCNREFEDPFKAMLEDDLNFWVTQGGKGGPSGPEGQGGSHGNSGQGRQSGQSGKSGPGRSSKQGNKSSSHSKESLAAEDSSHFTKNILSDILSFIKYSLLQFKNHYKRFETLSTFKRLDQKKNIDKKELIAKWDEEDIVKSVFQKKKIKLSDNTRRYKSLDKNSEVKQRIGRS